MDRRAVARVPRDGVRTRVVDDRRSLSEVIVGGIVKDPRPAGELEPGRFQAYVHIGQIVPQ